MVSMRAKSRIGMSSRYPLFRRAGTSGSTRAPRIRMSEGWSQKLFMVSPLRSAPVVYPRSAAFRRQHRVRFYVLPRKRGAPIRHRRRWLVFVVVLAGHDAEVAKPFGKDDDEDASAEAEYGPERGEVLSRRMGLVIAHEEDIRQGKQHEHRDANQRNGL